MLDKNFGRPPHNNSVDSRHPNDVKPTFSIPLDTSKKMYEWFVKFNAPVTSGTMREFSYDSAAAMANLLPMEVRNALMDVKTGVNSPRYIYIEGLPVDPFLPDTPNNGKWSEDKQTFISEAVLLGIAHMIGVPYAFRQEKDGKILHQITPAFGKEYSLSSAGSKSNLGDHIEAASDTQLRPDFVVLTCLRADKDRQAETTVTDIRDVLPLLSSATVQELLRPKFKTRIPVSFTDAGADEQWSEAIPILSDTLVLPRLIVDTDLTKGIDEAANEALSELVQILNEPGIKNRFFLKPGDCLIIPNRTAVHGRTPFTPLFNGHDRWLQRTYVRQTLWTGRARKTTKFGIYQ